MEVVHRQWPSGYDFVNCSQGRFHYPAGVGKYIRRAAGDAEWGIHFILIEGNKVDSRLFDHPPELPGSENPIHILES